MGERSLVNYGIQNDKSVYRFHVCFGSGMAYVFRTADGAVLCRDDGRYPKRPGYQPGVSYATAEGFLVPPRDIAGCHELAIPPDVLAKVNCRSVDSTTVKGNKAVTVAREMILRGLVPLGGASDAVTDKGLQIDGLDIVVRIETRIQVKCDFSGGRLGTGNLFLQVSEVNPLAMH